MNTESPESGGQTPPERPDLLALLAAALDDADCLLNEGGLCKLAEGVGMIIEVNTNLRLGECLSIIPDSPGGTALFRLLIPDNESLQSAARRIGCSVSSLIKAERKLRRFLGLQDLGNRRLLSLKPKN